MNDKTVKCPICGCRYKRRSFTYEEQSTCPDCRCASLLSDNRVYPPIYCAESDEQKKMRKDSGLTIDYNSRI